MLALGAGAFFAFGLPAIQGGGLTLPPGSPYAYASPQLDLDRDHEFRFTAHYDLAAKIAESGVDEFDTSVAFELFTDPGLTIREDLIIRQQGDTIRIESGELRSAEYATSQTVTKRELGPADELGYFWGLHERYYLVQKLAEDGTALDRPIVHEFTVKRALEPPVARYGIDEHAGNLAIEWDPVAGADEYLVVVSWRGTYGRVTRIVAETTESRWTSHIAPESDSVQDAFRLEQNSGLRTYRLWSAADIESASSSTVSAADNDTTEYVYGVIATNGTDYSPYIATPAEPLAGALPYQLDVWNQEELFPTGRTVESLDELPTRFPFTSLDGATRQTVPYIDPELVADAGDFWQLGLLGRGTSLGWRVRLAKGVDLMAEIERYNERVAAAAPPTGMPQIVVLDGPVSEQLAGLTPSTVAPETEYPVFGSNELTEYLAANMIAGARAIDVSAYTRRAGTPAVYDAVQEAVLQNPYIVGYKSFGYFRDTGIVYIDYFLEPAEIERLQVAVADVVDAAVAEAVAAGMSDTEKVTALNEWLRTTAEYDRAALDAAFGFGVPAEFFSAWDSTGVLLPEFGNLGVCQSYALAFKALLAAAGVESVVVTGNVFSGGGHAWNKVEIDGTWLAVDPTWNDAPDPDRYLLIGDDEFTGIAAREEDTAWMQDVLIPGFATG